ncbi:DUF924 family protein [Paracoccus pacificus]|uniref:DUF924 family protein n=1 Tax=Paracoccus pacificus TaxID=1463598 RepID=A0ABW4R5I9_9RHOB
MTPDDINDFWIHEVGPKGWYNSTPALDERIRNLFMSAWEDAETLTAEWADNPRGALAALILTDQFPRNMFRNDPRAYSTDPLARRIATAAVDAGFDQQIDPPARQFFYLPFEHSEDLADQDRAVALFTERMPGENLTHAQLHRDTIARFGRFPWRNKDLGRTPSPEEDRLMAAGGYGALVSGKARLDAL